MPETRSFLLADVLSITTGRLLSRKHIGGVYEILNYLTGDNLMTHQLPRACDFAEPLVAAAHPWLKDVQPPQDIDVPDLMAWLANAEREHGDTVDLEPLTGWQVRNPVEELCDMVGPEKVYVFPEAPGGPQ